MEKGAFRPDCGALASPPTGQHGPAPSNREKGRSAPIVLTRES